VNDKDRSERSTDAAERRVDPIPTQPRGLGVDPNEWRETWKAVLEYGLKTTESRARADDIRQEAYVRLMTTRPWRRDVPFKLHMLRVASSVRKHADKGQHRRERYEADWGAKHKRERGVVTASAEQESLDEAQRIKDQNRAARILAELRRRLAGYSLELRIIDWFEQADETGEEPEPPAALANRWGIDVRDLYRARERIRRYKDSVIAAVGGDDEEKL
jgi:DNA-directed RNA polymerase specialized sigma24 family protein